MTTAKQTYLSKAALAKAIRDEVARLDMDGLMRLASTLNLNLLMPVTSGPVSEPERDRAPGQPLPAVRVLQGSGLGPVVSVARGRRQLDAVTVENGSADWVESDLAGAGQVVNLLGISRATLDNWRKANRVIALRKGLRNFLYPLRQFERRRPLTGLDQIAVQFASPDDAWEWLVAPNRMTDGKPPVEMLRSGDASMVISAAEGALDYA